MNADEEMKTGEVHTDDTDVTMAVVQQPTVVTMTDASAVSWCLLHIDFIEHLSEHEAVFPLTQNGVWRATLETSHGAGVLLARHSDAATVRGEDPTNTAVHERHVQSHPHLLNLYGAGGRMFVCEEGAPFQDFVKRPDSHRSVLRVFYGVLLGLRFMHERGIPHGAVDAQHIVVGVNQKGKLLTRFPVSGEQPESEPFEANHFYKNEGEEQLQFRADEDAFVHCMTRVVTMLLARLSENGEAEMAFVEVLEAANVMLAAIAPISTGFGGDGDEPQCHMRRAADKLKRLADREAGACKQPIAVRAQ